MYPFHFPANISLDGCISSDPGLVLSVIFCRQTCSCNADTNRFETVLEDRISSSDAGIPQTEDSRFPRVSESPSGDR